MPVNIPDHEEILRSLQLLIEPGTVAEMRVLDTPKRTLSGYYDDPLTMAKHAASISDAPAIFLTVNPVKPDLLARAVNHIKPYAKNTTADADILRRRWQLVDFDPVRPAGISSTEGEHAAALARAEACLDWLTEQGWPAPVIASSGNGAHLLYRVDLPNDEDSNDLLKRVLAALASRFDDDFVKVDRSVFNAGQLTKLYGTFAQKGDATVARPHRCSQILWNGEATFEIVTPKQLTTVADALIAETKPEPSKTSAPEDIAGLLASWGLTILRTEEHQGQSGEVGTKFIFTCPFDPAHKAAAVFSFAAGPPSFKCFHASCEGMGWKQLRAKFEPWRQALIKNEKGSARPLLANAVTMLENDPAWRGVVAFDEFALKTVIMRPTPWPQSVVGQPWSDFDDSMTSSWLQGKGLFVGTPTTAEAIQLIAQQNPFHPVRTYLESLHWDEKPRLNTWLHDYLGAPDNPYTRAVGPRWMISAVARIYRPGVQADCALIALAKQGTLKSTMFRTLAIRDAWFSDSIDTLGDRDSRERLRGLWLIELSELSALRRSELEHVKSFLSCRVDRYRPSYGRRSIDSPRTCVFCGTSNDESPFVDSSGNRRFWPIRTGRIDLNALSRDRDMLWSEALLRFRAGESWWIDSEALEEAVTQEQEEAYEGGPNDDLILAWCARPIPRTYLENGMRVTIEPFDSSRERVTIVDVLLHGLAKPRHMITQADRYAVRNCLTHAGWKRSSQIKLPGNRNVRFYIAPQDMNYLSRKMGEED